MLSSSRKGSVIYRYAAIVVTMTDRDVIARVGRLVDEPVQTIQPSRAGVSKKEQYRVCVRGQRAVALMKQLRSLMGDRRTARIDEILAYEATRGDPNEARRRWSSGAASIRPRDEKGRLT